MAYCGAHESKWSDSKGESVFYDCKNTPSMECPYDYCEVHCKQRCTEDDHNAMTLNYQGIIQSAKPKSDG